MCLILGVCWYAVYLTDRYQQTAGGRRAGLEVTGCIYGGLIVIELSSYSLNAYLRLILHLLHFLKRVSVCIMDYFNSVFDNKFGCALVSIIYIYFSH